jgi:hypothetical protein
MLLLNELNTLTSILRDGSIVTILGVMLWYFFQYIKELNKELIKQRQGFEIRLDKVLQHQKIEFETQIRVMREELEKERQNTKEMFDKTISRLEKYDGWFNDMVKILIHRNNDFDKPDSS